ncbi:MAG: class I SAM-dependent methyltransferase [Candidatus Binatia bacterium]
MERAASTEFTGERPGWGKDFDYDESRALAAYRYAATLAAGKRVADAGCGEGFGTQLLADVATAVVGLDYSVAAIAMCRETWCKPNLSFRQADLTRSLALAERFDLVVNFQVLEHMRDDLTFLENLKTLLAPGGRLLLTTPNRLKSFSENPYHLREYTAPELRRLLERVFRAVTLLGMHGDATVTAFDCGRERAVKRILRLDPFGIRNRLPRAVVTFAFAKLAVLVRRQARGAAQPVITPDDFFVSAANLDDALDLVALCET